MNNKSIKVQIMDLRRQVQNKNPNIDAQVRNYTQELFNSISSELLNRLTESQKELYYLMWEVYSQARKIFDCSQGGHNTQAMDARLAILHDLFN